MKLILPLLILLISIIFVPSTFAKGMDVSKSASFSSVDLNFSSGETVYVRVNTDKVDTFSTNKEGSTHVLNVKDNGYSTIKSIDLSRSGSSYTVSFSAPSREGYYSLEAKIEGNGVSVTSVKTIKVGSPSEANIKVKVSSEVKGTTSSTGTTGDDEKSATTEDTDVDDEDIEENTFNERQRDIETKDIKDMEDDKAENKGVFEAVFVLVDRVLKFLSVVKLTLK